MLAAARAEWIRIGRVSYLMTAVGASGVVAVLFTALTVFNSRTSGSSSRSGPISNVTVADLSGAGGSTLGVLSAVNLLGVVALCIFASAFAADYSSGMLRNLLVRHPRRASLLAGKFAALSVLSALIVLVAVLAGIVTAYLTAPADVSTAQWLTAAGLAEIAKATGNLLLATLGFGLVGAALGSVTRRGTVAIAVGVAWTLPAEQILAGAVSATKQWLPGQLLSALAHGGAGSVGYPAAAGVLGLYAVVGITLALRLFATRDVTA